MKTLILTQKENVYLPQGIARVCHALREDIACLMVAPAMSTHGGTVKGSLRHLSLFGLCGTLTMAGKVLGAKARAIGRGYLDDRFYSVEGVGRALGIPCHAVRKVNSPEVHAILDRYSPDLLISMSCPQIIGQKVRERFPLGCINVHGALLPKYRGLMPAFWALRNGEPFAGVTVHDLADRLDNGAILLQRKVPISPDDTWDSLVRKTKAVGAEALVEAVEQIRRGQVVRQPNLDSEATYFSFPTAADRKAFRLQGREFF